jgi:hypothetical protein
LHDFCVLTLCFSKFIFLIIGLVVSFVDTFHHWKYFRLILRNLLDLILILLKFAIHFLRLDFGFKTKKCVIIPLELEVVLKILIDFLRFLLKLIHLVLFLNLTK